MKIVLDTSIWVSGLLMPKSNAGKIMQDWQAGKLNIVVSDPILKEIEQVLLYPKIAKRLQWDSLKIKHYLDLLKFFTELVNVDDCAVKVEKDPDDFPILATLIESKASWLVTGDKVILELKEQSPIISANDFCKLIS